MTKPIPSPLYRPDQEHDACGVGFIAKITGERSHDLVERALAALRSLAHRGAIDADAVTGDGAGLLTQIPVELLREHLEKKKKHLLRDSDLGVGMVFLPQHDESAQVAGKKIIEQAVKAEGLVFLGWREVPVDSTCLGRKALETQPHILQALVSRKEDETTDDEFERLVHVGGGQNRAVDGRLKLTEQGEVLSARYSTPQIAHRELELVAGATLVSTVGLLEQPAPARLGEFEAAMHKIASWSTAAYRDLVYGDPDFITFFQQVTPITEISELQLGSRPARRTSGSTRIDDLRAIPWVFSWTQIRVILPGWYGIGFGLGEGEKEFGLEFLSDMERSWPFFKGLLSNAEMAMAKADLRIAERYIDLVTDPIVRGRLWGKITSEYDRSVDLICRVRGERHLLDGDQVLQRSISRRNPYVDPLSFIQIELMRQLRQGGDKDLLLRPALLAINGIANGMKNTG